MTKPVPDGFHTLTPHIVVNDGAKAIEFYKKAKKAGIKNDRKAALQAELLARLYTLREVDASSRLQDLQSFAREQTPRLVELEKRAEQLRLDLIGRGTGESGIGPVIHDKFIMTAEEMKAAVFYGRGLSPAQRRLLLQERRRGRRK